MNVQFYPKDLEDFKCFTEFAYKIIKDKESVDPQSRSYKNFVAEWVDLDPKVCASQILNCRRPRVPSIGRKSFDKYCGKFGGIFKTGKVAQNTPEVVLFKEWQERIEKRFADPDSKQISPDEFYGGTPSNVEKPKSSFPSKPSPIKNDLDRFKKNPLYFYHSTKSEDGVLYWKLTVLDFTLSELTETGRLVTEVSIPNYSKSTTIEYSIEIRRQFSFDPVLLTLRSKRENEQIIMAILDPIKSYTERVSGLIYHDDWTTDWRLSGCLLSFTPLTPNTETGALPPDECIIVQKLWNKMFKGKDKAIFEEYKLPSEIGVR